MTRAPRATALHEGVEALAARALELAHGRPGPPWLQKLRRGGLASFERLGFPSTHDEEWRFTNLAPLARTVFALPPDDISLTERTAALELEARLGPLGLSSPEPRLVFVNGRPLRRNAGTLPPEILFESLATVLRVSPERVERALVSRAAERAKHFFGSLSDAFLDEGDTQTSGDGLDHRSFKIDILQNLRDKTGAVTGLAQPFVVVGIARF